MINRFGKNLDQIGPVMGYMGIYNCMDIDSLSSMGYVTISGQNLFSIFISSEDSQNKVAWFNNSKNLYKPNGVVEQDIKLHMENDTNSTFSFILPVIPNKGVYFPLVASVVDEDSTEFFIKYSFRVNIKDHCISVEEHDKNDPMWKFCLDSRNWTMKKVLENVVDRIGTTGKGGNLFESWIFDTYEDVDDHGIDTVIDYHYNMYGSDSGLINLSSLD